MTDEPGDDLTEYEEAMNHHLQQLVEICSEYGEDNELSEGDLVALLLEATLTISSLSYVAGEAEPSPNGLRRELDQLRKFFGERVRARKKLADPVVAGLREMFSEVDRENIRSSE